jgi:hypothetical protein
VETFRSGSERDPFWAGRENVFLLNIQDHYLGAPLQSRFGDPRLRFGILPDDIGYLAVSNFLDSSNGVNFATTLDAILAELEGTAGLVIDLRFNPGGSNANSLAFLERVLTPGVDFAFAQQTRLSQALPADFTELWPQPITPLDNPFYRRPVAVLTSQNSASGAETVLLPMLYEPRFLQVGEVTRGVFSKLLFRNLPNGWLVTLSNERHFSLLGVTYEQQGVPPVLPVEQAEYDLDNGVDAGLDHAIAAILAQPAPVDAPFNPGLAVSGLWYDPQRDGEGWHIQRVREDAVFVTFYSFDPEDPEKDFWAVGLGRVEGNRVVIDRLVVTEHGQPGEGAGDPPLVERDWGRGVISFSTCEEGIAEISGPDRFRGFTFRLARLSSTPGLGCQPEPAVLPEHPEFTGAWYLPEYPGVGWLVSHTARDRAVVTAYWVLGDGHPDWFIGVGEFTEGGDLVVEQMLDASGTLFGWGFDAANVALEFYVGLVFSLHDCNSGTIKHPHPLSQPTPEFEVQRLVAVEGFGYPDGCN